jgi:hypothetical protein
MGDASLGSPATVTTGVDAVIESGKASANVVPSAVLLSMTRLPPCPSASWRLT